MPAPLTTGVGIVCLNKSMKLKVLHLLLAIGMTVSAYAIPAKPGKTVVRQPDGSCVTIVLHGDEFMNYSSTTDGYTVVETPEGEWQYAVKAGGLLVASGITAHDAASRKADEEAFLSQNIKGIRPEMTEEATIQRNRARSLWKTGAQQTGMQKARYNYDNFRGLVLLVEWNDKSFSRSDAKEFFSAMVNNDNYAGYYTQGTSKQWISCTGSVRDYFNDNSMGRFKPTFDVVGPIKINRSCTYPNGTSNSWQCAIDAITAANAQVDFTKYDADNDGVVDMFYIIYAGYGSNVSGNSSRYIWPHATYYAMPYQTYDGKRMGRYACSTEMGGSEIYSPNTLDGIGVICHEFSHVLGLPDLYDTDYDSNGQSNDPGVWSVMAGGGYNNKSRTPTGYGSYERYAIGFMQPKLITGAGGEYSLEALNESNTAYRINSAVDKEYFLLENRQQTKWDSYLPGSGMLVFRVDSTNTSVWNNNKVNANPDHNYFELLRANPRKNGTTIINSEQDPFPGASGITEINNETEPSLKSWTGAETPLSIKKIAETNSVITFTIGDNNIPKAIEDFESMATTNGDATGVAGVFCNWDMVNVRVVDSGDNFGEGNCALGFVNGGFITSSAIEGKLSRVEFDVWNNTGTASTFVTGYSTDGGKTWIQLNNASGQSQIIVTSNGLKHIWYSSNIPSGSMIRIYEFKGSARSMTYIDNVKIVYADGIPSGIRQIPATNDTETAEAYYNLSGQRVSADTKGILIVKTRDENGNIVTRKVIKK